MTRNHQDYEFVAVRVQDPRIQNEGSWNSYVDYKIFLHTNSKAFTAKTSCVRRRYSEFVWLKRNLQKNTGLVQVPDLPGKSLFSFSNEDFLERRRKGLQAFLDRVIHMTVCLSDSQLHLFLQTQLPVSHIEDCVQGLTPYSVTDAILTYASSNQGLAQAQEEDVFKEASLTVSYESMESPAPHQPSLQTNSAQDSQSPVCGEFDPPEDILELCEQKADENNEEDRSSIRVVQKSERLGALVDEHREAAFYLGDIPDESDHKSGLFWTPVEVHSSNETESEDGFGGLGELRVGENSGTNDIPEQEERNNQESRDLLDLEKNHVHEQVFENNVETLMEGVCVDVSLENQLLEDKEELQEDQISEEDGDAEKMKNEETGDTQEILLQPRIWEEQDALESEDSLHKVHHRDEEQESTESDESVHSAASSNDSIIKCSEEESLCDDADDSSQTAGADEEMSEDGALWSQPVHPPCGNMLDLHVNGCVIEDINKADEEELQLNPDSCKSSHAADPTAEGDLTENSDFSVLESSCGPGSTDSRCTEEGTLSSLSVEESQRLEVDQ